MAPKLIGKKVRRENILAEVGLPENGFSKIEEEESKFYKFQGQGSSLETFGFGDVSVFYIVIKRSSFSESQFFQSPIRSNEKVARALIM